jgi:hypothetical protein
MSAILSGAVITGNRHFGSWFSPSDSETEGVGVVGYECRQRPGWPPKKRGYLADVSRHGASGEIFDDIAYMLDRPVRRAWYLIIFCAASIGAWT